MGAGPAIVKCIGKNCLTARNSLALRLPNENMVAISQDIIVAFFRTQIQWGGESLGATSVEGFCEVRLWRVLSENADILPMKTYRIIDFQTGASQKITIC
jgi:hypothetical protein